MIQWKMNRNTKWFHPVFWTLFFAGWYLFRVDDFPNQLVAIKITLVKVLVLASVVYFTNFLLIPFLLYAKKYWLFGLTYTAIIFGAGISKIYFIMQLLQPYYRSDLKVFSSFKSRFYDNIIPLFLLVSTGAAAKLVSDYIVSQKKLAAISQEKAETELQYLKSQINPHFVFNTLNAIYFQIDKSNPEARQTLLQFADLLRYQLYECNAEKISIEEEMAYLNDYIRLQQKRRDENYTVSFERSCMVKEFSIVPLLLIPFVENAFKHISHYTHKVNSVYIAADKKDSQFMFTVINTRDEQPSNELNTGGIGLRNVQRRLDLLYPGKYALNIHKDCDVYRVRLQITV